MKLLKTVAMVAVVHLGPSGCATQQQEPAAQPEPAPVTVFYGTNRNRLESGKPSRYYGERRGNLEYGTALVSGSAREEKTRLLGVSAQSREQFFEGLRFAVQEARQPTVLVFVHGYMRSFGEVSRQVAEFSTNTGFNGPVVMWTWPSTNNAARYVVDETNIRWAQPDFAEFLKSIIRESGAASIHLVGHSLGGRGLIDVLLQDLLSCGMTITQIGEVVLLAPDVDKDVFVGRAGPALVSAGLSVTLYAAANDRAMASAKAIHGYARAGDSKDGPAVVPGITTIDVTSTNSSVLGHSYFNKSGGVIADLAALLNEREPADRRKNLEERETPEGANYWHLTKTKFFTASD